MSVVEGKIALITGGAGGIGLSVVRELLRNGLKAVAIVDISEEAGRKAISEVTSAFGEGKAIFIRTDVTDEKQLKEAFEDTIKVFNQLDIVINNAGVVDELDWKKCLAINFQAVVEGTYLAQQKYLPKYKSGKEGIILNTASLLGLRTITSCPIYCATKHGVVALGQSLGAKEFYDKYPVRIMTICPGAVETPILYNAKSFFPDLTPKEFAIVSPEVQSSEDFARTVIKVLNEGGNGSVWVAETNTAPYEVRIPHWTTMKV